jgi:PAS domain S-box-containing protein
MNTSNSAEWNERCSASGSLPRDTESMFHLLFERTADAVWLFDPGTATVVDCNKAAAALMRCEGRTDLIGKRAIELSAPVQPDGTPTVESVARRIAETLKSGNSRFEWTARRFDGTELPLEVNATAIERDGKPVFVLVSRDITERKDAEAALLMSETRFRSLFERSADAMALFDPDTGRFIETNEAFARRIGAPSREVLRNAAPPEIWPERQPDGRLSVEKAGKMAKLALNQGSHRFEWLSRRFDGTELPLDIVMTAIPFGKRTMLFVVSRDISEHKRAEETLARLNRTLRTLYECNRALVRATEEYELLRSVCRILVEVGGLRMAWVGYREFNPDKTVRPVAEAGYEHGYLERVKITWANTERGRGPVGTAIRTGATSWNNDILTDPNMAPWRAEALKRGYASCMALPLMSHGEAFGALALYAEDSDAFTQSTIEQYTDLANNLAYGVVAVRTREEHKRAEEALQASEQRLQAIVDNTTAVIFVKDLELRYILVNREYERRHQVQREQIRGKTDFDIFPHDVAETLRANDRRVIEASTPIQFEETVPMTQGERIYVVVKFLLRDSSAEPYAVCGIATDITELKRAEELQARRARQAALRADIHAAFSSGTESALQQMLQSSAEAIVHHLDAAEARIWTLNDRQKMLDLQASAGLDARLDGEYAHVPVGQSDIGLIAQERRSYLTNDVLNDGRISRPDWAKEERLVSFTGHPLLVEGRLVGVLAMFAQKFLDQDTLEALEAVADTIAEGIERKRAEGEIRQLNASLEKRVAERTIELVRSNDQLKRAEEQLRKRGEQVQIHRDVLLELARSDKSDFEKALQKICSLSATTLEVARVSYWSLQDNSSAIVCEVLYLRKAESCDEQFKGTRLGFSDCPAYFEALATTRPIIAHRVLTDSATSCLAENYLKPLGISSMLDAPVWVSGELVGVLCHEHTGPARDWSAEEIDFVSGLAATVSLALEESSRAHSEHLLRESEERFSKAFRATPVSITILRLSDKKFVEANDAFVRWFGLDRAGILGHDSRELDLWVNLNERAKFLADLERNGSLRDVECQLRSRRGTVHTIVQSADIIEINREPHLLVIGLDITERKQAEAELLRTLAREKELGQLRSNFVSMVSHEFRTPLGIIQSSAEILDDYLDQLGPTERSDHLQSIRKNTRRMAGLMEEVLLIGSLDAGKMEFKPAPLDLRTFVRRLLAEVLSATNGRCPIDLLLGEMPAEIQADERLLQHIFTNLLTNGVKYSDAGRAVQLEIGRDGAEIVCAIRDQGIGIPEADREWLFNAFHRGHNVGDRPGTGLGLVIVKRCVDLHGGKITMESKSGEGTTVTVRLAI